MRNIILFLRGCDYFPVVVALFVMLSAFADQVIAAIDPKKVEILQRYAVIFRNCIFDGITG